MSDRTVAEDLNERTFVARLLPAVALPLSSLKRRSPAHSQKTVVCNGFVLIFNDRTRSRAQSMSPPVFFQQAETADSMTLFQSASIDPADKIPRVEL